MSNVRVVASSRRGGGSWTWIRLYDLWCENVIINASVSSALKLRLVARGNPFIKITSSWLSFRSRRIRTKPHESCWRYPLSSGFNIQKVFKSNMSFICFHERQTHNDEKGGATRFNMLLMSFFSCSLDVEHKSAKTPSNIDPVACKMRLLSMSLLSDEI